MKKSKSFSTAKAVKTGLLWGVFSLFCPDIQAQELTMEYYREGMSPQVDMMNRYGDYPVDLSTGLVDISIPLYHLQTPGISLPFELKFHPSGMRVDEREGLLGIRWVLSGLGHVSRTIKGYPDDLASMNTNVVGASNINRVPTFHDLFGTTSSEFLGNSGNINMSFRSGFYAKNDAEQTVWVPGGTYQDTEYDIFSYRLPTGKSGKFILERGTGYPMPYEPIKINSKTLLYSTANQQMSVMNLEITDENGIMYTFGQTHTKSGIYDYPCVDRDRNRKISSWHLTTITSANKKEVVTIEYVRPGYKQYSTYGGKVTISDKLHWLWHGHWYDDLPMYGELLKWRYFDQSESTDHKSLEEPLVPDNLYIHVGGQLIGKVSFMYDSDRYQHLKNMCVYDASNTIVQNIRFDVGKTGDGALNMLKEVEITGTGKYSINYYGETHNTACGKMQGCDWWGYYSSSGWFYGGNVTVRDVPQDNLAASRTEKTVSVSGGSKTTSTDYMKIGMVSQIQYPTGGMTEFKYEPNQYLTNDGAKNCGGLRINKIINYPEYLNSGLPGKTETKSYVYEAGFMPGFLRPLTEAGYGNNWNNIYLENTIQYSVEANNTDYNGRYVMTQFLNQFPAQFTEFHSNIVYYRTVTEYYEQSSTQKLKTVYVYDHNLPQLEYFQDNRGDTFRGFQYDDGDFHNLPKGTNYQYPYVSPKDFWHRNKLKSKTVYRGTSSGTYTPVKEYLYEYTPFRKQSLYDLPVFRYRHFALSRSKDGDYFEVYNTYPDKELYASFAFRHQEYTIGADRLTKETVRTYDDAGNYSTVEKETTYSTAHLLPTMETTTNSDGETITVRYTYPFSASGTVYSNMTARNILAPVVMKQTTYGGDESPHTEVSTTDYVAVGDGFYPSAVTAFKNGYATFQQLAFNNYTDRGRPMFISKDNAVENAVYLWSYNHQYPVAVIQNATYAEVQGVVGASFITTLANKAVPADSDYTTLDNLRNSLPNALITTCKYKPFIGKTWEKDPTGLITYYDYVNGRLSQVYVRANNEPTGTIQVLEAYEYNYVNK